MNNELIVFLHNDLDAAGCMLNIEYKYPQVQKKYFFTNYANLPEIAQEIKEYVEKNGNTRILCADVSFSDQIASLHTLNYLFRHGKITVIDHHMYPDHFWDDFPNVKLIWDKTKCASLICNEYFGNSGKNDRLDKLTKIIDIYDIWQDQHPGFMLAQDLNEYFWGYSVEEFVKVITLNNFKLPEDYLGTVKAINANYAVEIADFKKRNLIHRAGDITLCFVDKCFNQIMIADMKDGQNFLINLTSYGIIKVRINQLCEYSDEQLNKIRFILTGKEIFAHTHAFTYKIQGITFDKLMIEAKRVAETIKEITQKVK